MKHIDAELLLKEIKRFEKAAHKYALGCADSETRKFYEGKDFAYQFVGVLIDSLQQENKPNLLKSLEEYFEKTPKEQLDADWEKLKVYNEIGPDVETYCKAQREQQEVDLEKFTEKMDDWKARFSRPDDIPIKATMAFTARMFYMYPNVAREWYDSLPKVTQD